MNSLKIGKVKLKNQFILAPMEAVNCASFRLLCKEQGASLVYSQMLHSDTVQAGTDYFVEHYVDVVEKERPIAMQIVGSNPKNMKTAAEILDEFADIIDINLGCSVQKVLGRKEGAFFVKHPEQIEKIVKPVIGSTNKPVTAKIRIGWDAQSLNHLKVSNILEDLGVAAIAVHGRTRQQAYSGKANWTAIKQVKEKSNVPIIGNGDVFKPELARSMLEKTNCDGVMIGRAAMGNPFIFKQCIDYFRNGRYTQTTEKEVYDIFMRFLKYYDKHQARSRFPEIKQHAMWFIKYIPSAKDLRQKLVKTNSIEEVKKIYESLTLGTK